MASQIQGRDTTIRVFNNGALIRGLPVKKGDWEADQEIRKRDLLGEKRDQKQLLIHGYKGTFETDVDSPLHHDLVKFINENDKSAGGSNTYEFAIQMREVYKDGSSKSFRFLRVTIKIPKSNTAGRKEDLAIMWEWEAEDILYLN
ncbi:MAG TPA: hypothetical protein VK181_20490 [Rhizobium sp.]|nr:hypothetical protein [Rhizobium sp.]